jgi:hypothetical protein
MQQFDECGGNESGFIDLPFSLAVRKTSNGLICLPLRRMKLLSMT